MTLEEPRKPQNAFWRFFTENREALKEEAGSAKGPIVGKLAGDKWKALTLEERVQYEERAMHDKNEYEKAMEEFRAQGGVAAKRKPKPATRRAQMTAAEIRADLRAEAEAYLRGTTSEVKAEVKGEPYQVKGEVSVKREITRETRPVVEFPSVGGDSKRAKGATTAYSLWLDQNGGAIAQYLETKDAAEIGRVATQRWKGMPERTMAAFEQRAADLKASGGNSTPAADVEG